MFGMVHQRQRLPLGFEAGDHLLGVHARLDDLERHPAPDRFVLLGQPDLAHPALADDLEKPVRPDASGRVSVTVGGDDVLQRNRILETRCRPVWIAGHRVSQTPSRHRSQRQGTPVPREELRTLLAPPRSTAGVPALSVIRAT